MSISISSKGNTDPTHHLTFHHTFNASLALGTVS